MIDVKQIVVCCMIIVSNLVVTSGCASLEEHHNHRGRTGFVALDLLPYYEKFEYYYGSLVRNVLGEFRDLDDPEVAGYCWSFANGDRKIEADSAWWATASPLAREALVFHELGHCVLGREHRDSQVQREGLVIPVSLMSPYILDEFIYSRFYSYYIQELFDRVNRSVNTNPQLRIH